MLEQQVLDFVRAVYNTVSWPGVVALMAIESACIPLPSEVIMPLAGWLLVKESGLGLWGLVLAGFWGAVGCVVGSLAAYWVGKAGGRPLVEKYGKYVLISRRDLEKADRWFCKYGQRTIFFSRLLPVIRTFISFPAGVTRMELVRFSIYTFIGSFPWCLGLAYAGYLLGEHWERIREVMRPFDYLIVAAAVLLVAWYVYRHIRHAVHND